MTSQSNRSRDPAPWIALTLALAFGLLATAGCRRPIDLPPDLAGTWTTAHETYADTSFTLTSGSIEFDLGENGSVTHPIEAVYADTTDDGRDLFTIVYLVDGDADFRYHLIREGTPAEALIPEHQPDVRWTRAGS